MTILQLLNSDEYIRCYESVIKEVGLIESAVLGTLCSYAQKLGFSEFYVPLDTLCLDLKLSRQRVNKALDKLQASKFVQITKKGIHGKNVYTLTSDSLTEE